MANANARGAAANALMVAASTAIGADAITVTGVVTVVDVAAETVAAMIVVSATAARGATTADHVLKTADHVPKSGAPEPKSGLPVKIAERDLKTGDRRRIDRVLKIAVTIVGCGKANVLYAKVRARPSVTAHWLF